MKIQLLASANRTLKLAAIGLFCFSSTTTILAQEPMHALEHADRNSVIDEKSGDDPRPAPEVNLSVAQNPSPTGIFTVKTDEENVSIEVYDESLSPIEAEIASPRDGIIVIDLSKLDNGSYTMVATTTLGRSLVDLIKKESGNEDSDKMNEMDVNVYPNPSTGIFNVEAWNNADIQVFDRFMQPIAVPVQNLLDEKHRIDLTNQEGGIYFVQVVTKQGMATKQLMKR